MSAEPDWGAAPAIPDVTEAEPEADGAATGTAWPHLEAPATAVAGRSFQIQVGLGDRQDPAVYGTGMLAVPQGNFTLGVELIVDGFMIDGDRTFALDVTAENRYPRRTVTLVASANPQFAPRRRIGVIFRVGREMRGYAARDIFITTTEAEQEIVPSPGASSDGFDISPFTAPEAADLTIIIQQGDAAHGSRFVWSVASPYLDIALPPDGTGPALLSPAERFLSELVAEASTTTDALSLVTSLTGRGKAEIAPLMPRFVKDALRSVALAVAPRRPTVLLLSQDPYIPWELAVLGQPLPGWPSDASPFLGAQAVIGRWVLAAEPPPAFDPPKHLRVHDEVIVAGDYEGVLDWSELKSATDEAKKLRQRWPAACPVEASLPAVLDCLTGSPEADIIHFALHGRFATDDASQGLVLIGTGEDVKYPVYLKPSHVDAGRLSRAPLVFLNACQVGAGRTVLGNYSGMASAFVRAGASAVIAPLWSVNDEVASTIAINFCERVLDADEAPAEVLRAYRAGVTRAAIDGGDHAASGTHIAYQFFGHPNLRVADSRRPSALLHPDWYARLGSPSPRVAIDANFWRMAIRALATRNIGLSGVALTVRSESALLVLGAVFPRPSMASTFCDFPAAEVALLRGAIDDAAERLGLGGVTLAWVHTHPRLGVFLSGTDRATADTWRALDPGFTPIVIDPHMNRLADQIGVFDDRNQKIGPVAVIEGLVDKLVSRKLNKEILAAYHADGLPHPMTFMAR